MNSKTKIKIAVDIAMTITLLLLMSYEMVGSAAHEWLGIGIFSCFIIHHILNNKWTKGIFKGKYTPLRIWQTILVAGVFLSIIGSMVSGIMLSRHIFTFLNIRVGIIFARILHMISAYWGFVLMSLHLGFHWSMMLSMAFRAKGKASARGKWLLRIIGVAIAAYGIYAFVKRDIWNYLMLKNHFAFFDFEEPIIFFLLDYMAVMGLFVWIGHYVSEFIKHSMRKK